MTSLGAKKRKKEKEKDITKMDTYRERGSWQDPFFA
jgi:hypothetical protein